MPTVKIGFIGLGLMGFAMVSRLLDKGYPVTVMANRSRPNINAAVARGAVEVSTPREVAEHSDITMLCMDNSVSVEARMRGDDGIIAGLREGGVVIDFGTSLPESTRTLAAEVAAVGGAYLDAPIGRTPKHAEKGLLNLMTAGDKAAFERVKPVLEDMGENIFYLGTSGAGHTIKLMNNFFGMTTANAMAEVFAMADISGVSRESVYEVIAAGPLHSMMMDFVKTYAIDNDPTQLAFSVQNAAKDVNYYNEMIKATGTTSAFAPHLSAQMNEAVEQGRGDAMVSEMVDFYAEKLTPK